jgi:hypothetical protein
MSFRLVTPAARNSAMMGATSAARAAARAMRFALALPLGKLDRPPQCSHPHEHRFAPELSRRAGQVGSIGRAGYPNGYSRACNNR